jgi:putative hemolysin
MFEVAVVVVLILINGFFVMGEIAVVSSRKVRLEKKAKEGSRGAAVALKLASNPQRTLSTIQFFITLLGFVAAAYGGNELSEPIADYFRKYELTNEYADILGISTVVAFTTYLSLVLGELVPKTIALTMPERMAIATSRIMQIFGWIAAPIVLFLQGSTKLMLKLFGIKANTDPPVTEEELQHMIEQGSEHGVIEEAESQMMRGVFRIGDRKVSALMTHRMEIVWIDVNATQEEIFSLFRTSIHSSFPVCDGDLDHIVGIVFIKDVATQIAEQQRLEITKIMKKPLFVPETMDALELLDACGFCSG